MGTIVELKPEHLNLVNQLAKEHGFKTFDIDLSSGSKKGENYLSQIILATIKDKTSSKSLDVIFKLASDNESIRKKFEFITKIFSREVYVYETVLPAFIEYENKHDIKDRFEATAKEYGSNLTYLYEILALENMKIKNYKLWDRRYPMDEEHTLLVLANYAKLHAVSFSMSQLDQEKFNKLTANMDNVWIPDTKEKFEEHFTGVRPAFLAAENALKEMDRELTAFKRFFKNIPDIMVNEFGVASEDDLVVVHGDCWCNNMLLQYEDSQSPNKPTKLCLIDWQLSGKRSPAMDLAFFLCCSVSGKDLSENFDRYLRFYYDKLSENANEFGGNLAAIFPYSLLEKHFKKYSQFGFYMSVVFMQVLVHEDGEEFDIEDSVDARSKKEMKNEKLYRERIRDIAVFMTEREYI